MSALFHSYLCGRIATEWLINMDGLEEQLGAILNNPQMMASLMQMAQNLGASTPPQAEAPPQPQMPDWGIDMGMLQKIGAMAQGSNIDPQQRNLLSALTPYLHNDRISRLEKAMRAARLARVATSAFSGR